MMLYKKTSQQNGSSLLYVILMLGIMLVIAFSMAVLSVSSFQTTSVNQRSQKAFYLAESGVERALYELKDPNTTTQTMTNPITVGTDGSYRYCFAQCGSQPVPPLDHVSLPLNANESKKEYYFDPTNLSGGSYTQGLGPVSLTITCPQCAPSNDPNNPAPALEVTVYSFRPSLVSSFDLNKLQDPNLNSAKIKEDESGITIDSTYYNDMSQYTVSGIHLDITDIASPDKLFMVQLHALQKGATYELQYSSPLPQTNNPTIVAIGEVKNPGFGGNARRAIELTYSKTESSLDAFTYTLLENTAIEKFAK